MMLCNGVRIQWRLIRRTMMAYQNQRNGHQQRVLIYGAGMGGSLVANEYKRNPHLGKKVVGFIDDDQEKLGTLIGTIPVYGNGEDLETIVKNYDIDEVIIAIANLDHSILKSVSLTIKRLGVSLKIMPGLFELIDGKFNVGMIREVEVEDLLARDSIKLDYDGISDYLENQVVMVTGGGGSIGSELCRQIVKFNPKQLIILDIYENNAYDLQNELIRQYPELNLVTLIASVRDRHRLDEIYQTYQPNVVFHAAAHKHVPLMEVSPSEAIKNNVVGTLNTAELASKYNVKRFVLISTDKAVNPTNVMGATKRLCEMIIQAINGTLNTAELASKYNVKRFVLISTDKAVNPTNVMGATKRLCEMIIQAINVKSDASKYNVKRFVLISTDKAVNPTNVMGATKRLCEMIIQAINVKSETEFVAVRFGNVLGSNGSVIPLFKKQIAKGGPVTLTHKDITRYFMTIPEAAQLVLQAGGFAQGGEIFVLDMGKPVKIYDLAENLIKLSGYEPNVDIDIEVTGLRPGEKLYEELLMDEEGLTETRHQKIFIGLPGEFELDTVKSQINELLQVATTKGIQELKDKLKEVVPTYEEPEHHKVG